MHKLTSIQNWFQNRRAKVKHEEKKNRSNISNWSSEVPPAVPLSEYGFLNDAFLQTQEPIHLSHPGHYPTIVQAELEAEVPVSFANNAAVVGDCPTIQEEPPAPDDSNAFMSFMGIDPQDGRHIHLQDVSHISKQFNPHALARDGFVNQSPFSSSFAPSVHMVGSAQRSQSVPGPPMPPHHQDPHQPEMPMFDGPQPSARHASHAGILSDHQIFDQSWMIPHQHSQAPSSESSNFGIEDARQMVNQLQAQASQPPHSHVEHHVLVHANSPVHLAVPQPMLPSQGLSLDTTSDSDNAHESHAFACAQEPEHQAAPPERLGLSRTDSGTSMLADTMGGVRIDPAHAGFMRPPSRTPSMSFAHRRQKRPANISAAASRSYSGSHTPLSASDRHHNGSSSDAHLRRIKSSSGVLNGRVQKPSGQRSPLYQSHFAESNPHLTRQMSTNSLNAAVKREESSSEAIPVPPPLPSATLHGQYPSNGSGLTNLTIPEDASQTPESVWSRMPSTADTTNTSLYYSVPQTANTAKSYASPPHTPMEYGQLAHMQLNSAGSQPPMHSGFPSHSSHSQPHPPNTHAFPQGMASPPEHVPDQRHAGHAGLHQFSTDDLVMGSIPMGHAGPEPPPGSEPASMPMQQEVHHHEMPFGAPITPGHPVQGFPEGHFQNPLMMNPMPKHHNAPEFMQQDFPQQPQHQQFVWNLSPDSQQADQRQNQDLQIHQFTPSHPVDPSNLPPKQAKASPRQTYSFQNFGPDHYSSPKSQSSQSKSSTPGPQHIGV